MSKVTNKKDNIKTTNEIKNTKKLDKKKLIIITITILVLLSIVLTSFFILKNRPQKEGVEPEEKENISNENENKRPAYCENNFHFHLNEFNNLCKDAIKEECEKETFTILLEECVDLKILDVAYDNYVLYEKIDIYEDNKEIYLYNNDTKETTEIDISTNATDFQLQHDHNEKNLYGIKYTLNNKKNYYNIKTSKTLYENIYDEIWSVSEDLIDGEIKNKEKSDHYLLDANEEKTPYITVKNEYCASFRKEIANNDYYISVNKGCTLSGGTSYYTKDLKKITDYLEYKLYSLDSSGNLLVQTNENTITKYNPKGEIIKTYKPEGKIMSIYSDLYTIIKDNILYIEEYNGKDYKLMDWNEDYNYYSNLSGYFSKEALNWNEKEAGYYFIIGYNEFEESPGIRCYFNPQTKEIKSRKLDRIDDYY